MSHLSKRNRFEYVDIESLYNQHIDDLYAYAMSFNFDKDTCLDVIHDLFYKVCLNPEQIKSIKNIKAYLLRSVRNKLFDIHKANARFINNIADDSINTIPFDTELTVEDQYISIEEIDKNLQKVQAILDSLTPRQREIIYLRYLEEMEYEEISKIMKISIHSSRKMVYEALQKLRTSNLSLPLLLCLSTLGKHSIC